MRFELSYLFTDFFGPVESNIKEEQFTQIFEHLIGISQKPR